MDEYSKLKKVKLEIRNEVEEEEHFHQDIELIYVLDGYMQVDIGEQKSELNTEDILIVNANKKHCIHSTDKNILYIRLEIAYQLVSDIFESVDITFWCDSSKGNDERYDELRKVLKELLKNYIAGESTGGKFEYISLCYKVLNLMTLHFLVQIKDKENIKDKDRYEERILKINNYIRSNYAQNISLKELSEKLYLSIGYLSRFFKKNYGMGFGEYLTNIRLYHAVDDLLYTNISITHIAYNNGFTNAAVFNKAFKKAYGETPSVFRCHAKNKEQIEKKEKYDKEIEKRLLDIIGESVIEQKIQSEKEYIEVKESAKSEQPLERIWSKMINIGSAEDLLRSEIREHVILLKEALGIEYMRFWNIFSKEMLLSLSDEGKYNFTRLDYILDFFMRNGIKPHIELGTKPKRIQKNVQATVECQETEVLYPTPEVWKSFMKALMKHLVLRYGQEQMNSWRIELWWDERITHDTENQKRYLQMFQNTYQIVKLYCPLLEVGGYGMRGNYRADNLIEIWKSELIQPDFISASLYAYVRGEENQDKFSKRNTDTNALKNVVTAMREYMNELGMQNTKLYVTEWNLTISDRNYINDTCFKGAYIIKNYLDFYGVVDMAGYFAGSDRISEYYDTNGLLYGGTGILSKDGILKPAGFAFEFLNRLYPYYIGKGSNYIVSSNRHGIYGILCHNMRRLNYNYYFSKENELEKEQMWKYVEDRKQMEFNLTLSDIEPGEYQQKIYRINTKNGNIFKIWREMGFIDELDREDIEYLRRICEPKILIEEIVITDCDIEVNIIIEPNEIVFVRLRKIG